MFILAHELGHHFSIKNNNDHSEASADAWIATFFTEYVPPEYQKILEISIKVYSGVKEYKIAA
jgi:hypothetical protein